MECTTLVDKDQTSGINNKVHVARIPLVSFLALLHITTLAGLHECSGNSISTYCGSVLLQRDVQGSSLATT